MKRAAVILLLTLAGLTLRPTPALADATAFIGWSPTVATRSTTGVAIGVSAVVLGFEFEYAHLNNDQTTATPSLGTGMFNLLIMTPTKLQLYVTAGGGIYHEALNAESNTSVGVNVGGGIKIPIAGPLRVRVDYRVMTLSSSIVGKPVQRFYVGGNFAF